MAIAFESRVKYKVVDRMLKFSNEMITLSALSGTQAISYHIKAANFYFHNRKADHWSLRDSKTSALLVSLKSGHREVMRNLLSFVSSIAADQRQGPRTTVSSCGSLSDIAMAMASQWHKNEHNSQRNEAFILLRGPKSEVDIGSPPNSRTTEITHCCSGQ